MVVLLIGALFYLEYHKALSWVFFSLILNINDLLSVVLSPMKIFADDVAIYCPVASTADCKVFQKHLDLLLSWCST